MRTDLRPSNPIPSCQGLVGVCSAGSAYNVGRGRGLGFINFRSETLVCGAGLDWHGLASGARSGALLSVAGRWVFFLLLGPGELFWGGSVLGRTLVFGDGAVHWILGLEFSDEDLQASVVISAGGEHIGSYGGVSWWGRNYCAI